MKTIGKIMAIFSVILMFACNSENKQDQESELLKIQQMQKEDSLEQVFVDALTEIDQNLELIREKELSLVLGPNSPDESNIELKDKIIRNIQMINSIMEKNREKLTDLDEELKAANSKNAKLQKLTKTAKSKLEEMEKQLAQLKEDLVNKDFSIAELNKQLEQYQFNNQLLTDMVNKYDYKLNKVYYTYGTPKELKEDGVIDKKGGVLWFGETKTINEDVAEENFIEIDKRETTVFPLFMKKAKLISEHPDSSYKFNMEDGMIASLEVTDPDEFWKVSKYMVIEVR